MQNYPKINQHTLAADLLSSNMRQLVSQRLLASYNRYVLLFNLTETAEHDVRKTSTATLFLLRTNT